MANLVPAIFSLRFSCESI